MSHAHLLIALTLALLVAGLSVTARRLRIASPIVMLVAGAGITFIPDAPKVPIDPDFVLLILLPPLLYYAGVGMSWLGFRANLRPILLLAIGCVLFTAAGVATAVHLLLGVPWPIGFVLGAIVSPPDAVAPMAVLRSVALPRRMVTILEGESLVNDATALVTLGFALAAVGSAHFSLPEAIGEFLLIAGGEIAFGMLIGLVMLRLRHAVDDARAEVLLALATPFIAFWPPHFVGGSGVIACVSAGLYVSWNGRSLISPATRLQGFFIWDLVVWGIEAFVFLLAGLQARTVFDSISREEWPRAIAAAGITSIAVIVIRFLCVYPATYLPRWASARLRSRDPMPDWRETFLLAFTGLRGAVSLAAALLIPLTLNGEPFPDRDLVLFATYSVICVTLVGLGGLLPAVVRWTGIDRSGAAEAKADKRAEHHVRLDALNQVLRALEQESGELDRDSHAAALQRWHDDRREFLKRLTSEREQRREVADASLDLRLLAVEREAVARAYVEGRLTDEARRRIERELDLEDARIRQALISARD